MKRFLLFFALSFFVLACGGDDDDTSTPENGFTYQGNFYETDLLIEEFYDSGDIGLLIVGDITFDIANEILEGTEADGLLLDFQFQNGNSVSEGTYSFNEDDVTPNTFYGEIIIDYNTIADSGYIRDITGGTVTVSRDGMDYIIDYNLSVGSNSFNGFYRGEIDYIL